MITFKSLSFARLNLNFGFAVFSQILTPDADSIKVLKDVMRTSKEIIDLILHFVPFYHGSVKLAVFSDSCFASNADLTSQLSV